MNIARTSLAKHMKKKAQALASSATSRARVDEDGSSMDSEHLQVVSDKGFEPPPISGEQDLVLE